MIDPGLSDKVALVTGANNPRGIDGATARAIAAQGAAVFLHYYRASEQARSLTGQLLYGGSGAVMR